MASHESSDHGNENIKRLFDEQFEKGRRAAQMDRLRDRAAILQTTGGSACPEGDETLTKTIRLGSPEGPRVIAAAKMADDPDCLRVSIGEALFRSSPKRCYVRYRGGAAEVLALLRSAVTAMEAMVDEEVAPRGERKDAT